MKLVTLEKESERVTMVLRKLKVPFPFYATKCTLKICNYMGTLSRHL